MENNTNIQPTVLENAVEGVSEPVANNGSKKTLIVAGSTVLVLLVAGVTYLVLKKRHKKNDTNTETEEETVVE